MRIPRCAIAFAAPAILIALGLGLVGCSTPSATDPDPGVQAPTGTTTDGNRTGAWDACPAIVASLNGNAGDPSDYTQLDPTGFAAQEVGSDVLGKACVIAVATDSETFTWAIIRGDAALAAAIKADLLAAGFEAKGQVVGNPATGQGVLIADFANGAALDGYLVYTTAFAPYDESLIYLGTFALG